MLDIAVLNYFREVNIASMVLRLVLALLLGGLIGMERERKKRPAGFRTYMLVCMGSALTMILGQYLSVMLQTQWSEVAALAGNKNDISRFSAQVINGIGFLGAGTILVTGRQEVKGLTTAAGLWTSGCMGLALGAGFYECSLLGFLMIFLSVHLFPKIENAVMVYSRNMVLYVEFASMNEMAQIVHAIKAQGIRIFTVDFERENSYHTNQPSAVFTLRLPPKMSRTDVFAELSRLECIHMLDEL